jgi:hypothetical protein
LIPGVAHREAYLQQAVVPTPHPQAHSLYADKHQLAPFSDDADCRRWACLQRRNMSAHGARYHAARACLQRKLAPVLHAL